MKNEFSSYEVADALGIKKEAFRGWIKEGFIEPQKPADGRGTKSAFSIEDVFRVELFRRLLKQGYSRERAKWISTLEKDAKNFPNFIIIQNFKSRITVLKSHAQNLGNDWNLEKSLRNIEEWDSFQVINFLQIKKEIIKKLEGVK